MKNAIIALAGWFFLCGVAVAHAQNLESVLNSMDQAAANFHSAQCDFVSDQYQKVVDDHDFQKGTMYFRRQGDDVEMAADITSPDKKYVLFTGNLVSFYQPSIDQVTEYNAGKNKADFESFLVLGFGGAGHDLSKSYDVNYAGMRAGARRERRQAGADAEVAAGAQHVFDDHVVDRSRARRQRAAEVR